MSGVPMDESMTPRGQVGDEVPATTAPPAASSDTTPAPLFALGFNTVTSMDNFFGSTVGVPAAGGEMEVGQDDAIQSGVWSRTPVVEERKIEPPALSTFPTPFEGDPNAEEWDVIMNKDGGSFAVQPKYLKEMELLRMLAQIREKPEWWLKVHQPLIVNRWKKEMYQQADLLTPQTIEYGIQELKYQSQLYQQSSVRGHSILPSAIDGVYQNDQLISPELLQQLKECLKLFEDVPESERDYHPGSDNQVIDLVHPSLYCLRYGKTKLTKEPIPLKDTLRSIGSGEIVSPLPNHGGFRYATSKNYAWLPAEFEVSPDGSKVKINSYVNNIHPIQHAKLYSVLEEIFASFIPMFEGVLSHLKIGVKSRLTRMNDQKYFWFDGPQLDVPSTIIFEDHLTQERAALKDASNHGQDEPFYLDAVKKKPGRGISYDQFRATVQLGQRIRHKQKLSRPAQVALIQFQDRLARLYLESTFDAFTKIEGLLTHPLHPNPSVASNSSQPPFIGLPDDLRVQLPRLLKSIQFAMADCAARSLIPQAQAWWSATNLGVFTEKMTQRWFVLFKRRLASLYPTMDQSTQHQYLSILLKKEYANLVRLGAAIQSVSGEIIELAGIIAARGTNSKLIELNHIQSGLNHDHELQALDRYLTQRYLSPHHTTSTSTVSSSSSGSSGADVVAAAARLNDISADELAAEMRDFAEERSATSATIANDMEDEEMKVSAPHAHVQQVNQVSPTVVAVAASHEEELCKAMRSDEEKNVWLAGELKRKQLDPVYDQNEATLHLLLGMKVDGRHPWNLTFSPTAQEGLVQLQDGLARLYLESTFDACMKAPASSAVVEPPLIDFHLSEDLLKQMYQVIPISHKEMTKAMELSEVGGGGTGTIFTESIAQRWIDLFKDRLPALYPELDPVTRQQYLDVVLKKENHPLSRLCAGIQYLISEVIELSGNCARDFRSNVICLNHLVISIHNDAEISVLTAQLQQRYPPTLVTDPCLQPEPIVPIMIPKANEGAAAAETTMVDVMDDGASLLPSMEQKEPDGGGERAAAAVSVDESLLEYAVNLDNSYGNHEDLRWKDIYQPEVAWPFSPDTTAIKNTYSLVGRTLQVIVKLLNIELTPEKPNYLGGAWHVEGMRNESIVASGIYYIHDTNITESRLSFRAGVSYFDPQDNSKGPLQVYGLTRERGLNQELGSLLTKSGRAIAFPNIYQHQVQPFQLADPTLPGKRQILVFFLVDPTIHITSTANVPPQQRHWLKTATGENTPTVLAEMNAGTPLIPDLVNLASEYYADSGVIDHAEACRVREESLKERTIFNEQNTRVVFQRPFWVEYP